MLIDYFKPKENIEFSKYLKTKHKKIKIIIDRCIQAFLKEIFFRFRETD